MSSSRRSRADAFVRRSSSTGCLPIEDAQTARPAKKPDAPSAHAHSTAVGKTSSCTPEESTTQGPAIALVSSLQARRTSASSAFPWNGTSAL